MSKAQQHIEKAQQLLGRQKFLDAIKEFKKAIEIDDQPLTHVFCAITYGIILGGVGVGFDEKRSIAAAAIPDYDIAIDFSKKGGSVPGFNRGLPDFYFQRGNAYLYLGDANNAIKDINSAIALNPREADFWCQLGGIYLDELENPVRASDYFIAAIELNQSARYFLFLAWCFIDMKDMEKAMVLIHKAATIDINVLDMDRKYNDLKMIQWRMIRSSYAPYARLRR